MLNGHTARMQGQSNRRRAGPWDIAATALVDELVAAAESIAAARAPSGERVFPVDAESRLLRAVEISSYCLAIADVARALRMSRQAAHKLVYGAVAIDRVELLPNPDDLRILFSSRRKGAPSSRVSVRQRASGHSFC